MKVYYIGLSSFLIENEKGLRILIDPFNNAPEWTLGPKFPKTFRSEPFGANIVLMSEPDADHSYAPGGWLQHAPPTLPNSDPFPELNLRGTVIYEYNGDVNIAWQYTVDGVRLAHFGDNAHLLTDAQIAEIGSPDIIFMSPQKVGGQEANDVTRKNIALLKPKIVIWAHHIVPKDLPHEDDSKILRNFFVEYFKNNARTNKGYENESSFMELVTVLENAIMLNKEYGGIILDEPILEISDKIMEQAKVKLFSVLFRSMLAE